MSFASFCFLLLPPTKSSIKFPFFSLSTRSFTVGSASSCDLIISTFVVKLEGKTQNSNNEHRFDYEKWSLHGVLSSPSRFSRMTCDFSAAKIWQLLLIISSETLKIDGFKVHKISPSPQNRESKFTAIKTSSRTENNLFIYVFPAIELRIAKLIEARRERKWLRWGGSRWQVDKTSLMTAWSLDLCWRRRFDAQLLIADVAFYCCNRRNLFKFGLYVIEN